MTGSRKSHTDGRGNWFLFRSLRYGISIKIAEHVASTVRRDGCVIGHHAPLPRVEAQGSDRAARRDAVSAPRRPRRVAAASAHLARLHARHRSPRHGHGGRRKGDEER